jgi:hypothetical protein
MNISELEAAVISRMLNDHQLAPSRRTLEPSSLMVTERNVSEVGFIASFARTVGAKLFGGDFSMRWGKVVGRLNAAVDVDFVVYIDDGYLTGVEGCTFGGEAWPADVEEFELTDIPNR